MTRLGQKARELAWVKEAQDLGGLPAGDVSEFEGPDALLWSGSKRIGIEVTDYVRGRGTPGGSKLRAIEMDAWKFARAAQATFDRQVDTPLHVTFGWLGRRIPRDAASRTRLASQFALVVAQHIPEQELIDIRISDEAIWRLPLADYVTAPFVRRLRSHHQPLWGPVEGGGVGSSPAEIQACIAEKTKKLHKYRRECDQVYLLIVADGGHVSSDPGDTDTLEAHTYQSDFDGVLFLNRIRWNVARLACEAMQ